MSNIVGLLAFLASMSLALMGHAEEREGIMPKPSEVLPEPIKLTKSCSKISIIEWRGTDPNKESSDILDKICNEAFNKFRRFVSYKGYNYSEADFSLTVSLIPAHPNNGGSEYRNLNDINKRFANRTKYFTPEGRIIPIWGYYHFNNNHIFIRNDVLNEDNKVNDRFVTIWAHELFHAMSYRHGIRSQHNRFFPKLSLGMAEEKRAEQFTQFLGLGI